jgi:hypothetical protein
MRKRSSWFFYPFMAAIVLAGAACASTGDHTPEPILAPTSTGLAHTPTRTATIPPQPILPQATTSVPTQQNTPTVTASPTDVIISPAIEQYCPEPQEVPISELGLNSTTRMFFSETLNGILYSMASSQAQPEPVAITPSDSGIFEIYISPDQKWFIYHEKVYQNPESKYQLDSIYDYWISSIDGTNRWLLAAGVDAGVVHPHWISNDRVDFIYRIDMDDCPIRLFALNPFSLEKIDLVDLPLLDGEYCIRGGWVFNHDGTKVVYPASGLYLDSNWILSDINQGKSFNIFPWLSEIEPVAPWKYKLFWTEDGFSFVMLRSLGFDVLINLPESAIKEDQVSIESYKLPGEILNYSIAWQSKDVRYLGFDVVEPEIDQNEYFNQGLDVPSNFYLFDTQTRGLRDYCLDRSLLGINRGDVGVSKATYDHRFLAWSIRGDTGEEYGIIYTSMRTMVLNLETGQVAILDLPGYTFLGWGEVSDPQSP